MADWVEIEVDEDDRPNPPEEYPNDLPEDAVLGRRWEMVRSSDTAVEIWGVIKGHLIREWYVVRRNGSRIEATEAHGQKHAEGLAQGLQIQWSDEL